MKAITIKDLYKMMREEMMNGHGDYVVFVTDDEEANGYHALWFAGMTPEEMGNNRNDFEENNHDLSVLEDKDKAYYLG